MLRHTVYGTANDKTMSSSVRLLLLQFSALKTPASTLASPIPRYSYFALLLTLALSWSSEN